MGVSAKKRTGMKAVVLKDTPCTDSLGGERGGGCPPAGEKSADREVDAVSSRDSDDDVYYCNC